jgi:hypothetical protein
VKIRLPKTLAEPLTLPWASIASDISDAVVNINMKLYLNFKSMEEAHVLPGGKDPGYQFSVGQVCKILEELALCNGAISATAYDYIRYEQGTSEKIGYCYQVHYTVPDDTTRYDKWLYTK